MTIYIGGTKLEYLKIAVSADLPEERSQLVAINNEGERFVLEEMRKRISRGRNSCRFGWWALPAKTDGEWECAHTGKIQGNEAKSGRRNVTFGLSLFKTEWR